MPYGFRILTDPPRPSAELVARLASCDPADLSDVMRHARTMTGLTPLWDGAPTACGPAVTVSLPLGGVHLLRAAMDRCRPGDVLVVAARGATEFAMFGGAIARAMANRGLAGLVVDGAVRDRPEIMDAGLPTYCRGVATAASVADAPGEINIPVACAGAVVFPGDIVVAGPNGVVAVPPEHAAEILTGVDALHAKHESWTGDVVAGQVPMLGVSLARLAELGCDPGPLVDVTTDGGSR